MSDPGPSLPGQSLGRARGTTATTPERRPQGHLHLLEEPVPALADPFPELDPLPGAYAFTFLRTV